jgi:endonuclease YncB( thermonuclease family)
LVLLAALGLGAPAAGQEGGQDGAGGDTAGQSDWPPDTLPGPIPAELVRVIDGDTLVVRAHIWLGQTVETHVRLAGIDTPELRGDCPAERDLARRAADRLIALAGTGPLALGEVRLGSFAGRVVARVETGQGDAGARLIAEELAAAYDGRGARPDWCAILADRAAG